MMALVQILLLYINHNSYNINGGLQFYQEDKQNHCVLMSIHNSGR